MECSSVQYSGHCFSKIMYIRGTILTASDMMVSCLFTDQLVTSGCHFGSGV